MQYESDKDFYFFVKIALKEVIHENYGWTCGKVKSLSLDAHIPRFQFYGPHLRALHPLRVSGGLAHL